MRAASLVAAALLAAPLGAAQNVDGYYITDKDAAAVTKANAAAEKFCSVGDVEGAKDPEEAKEALEGAVGDRPIYQALMTSTSSKEFGDRTGEAVSSQLVGGVVAAIAPAVLSLILCVCCFCTTNPCAKNMKCCRPCAALRENTVPHKVAAVIPVAIAFLVTIIGMATSSGGSSTMVAGFDSLACESAELLNSTLQGQTGTFAFIGLVPALTKFRDVEMALGDGSSFVTQLFAAIDDTKMVSESIEIAKATLTNLGNVLDHTATEIATTTVVGYQTTYRKCDFCTTLTGVLSDATTGLENGVGQALANARVEVRNQLSPAKRTDIRKMIRDSSQPMIDLKEQFIQSIGGLVDQSDEGFKQVKDNVPNLVMLVFLGSFVTLILGTCSTGCCIMREKHSDGSYNKAPHRLACCTFILAFPFAILSFILGGVLTSLTTPVADVCLILDDLDGDMVRQARPALSDGGSTSSDDDEAFDSFVTLIDNCINPANKSLNAKFLDLIEIKSETTGTKQTMGAALKDAVTAPIDSTFNAIATNTGSISLANSEPITKLMETIRNNSIEKVIIVDPDTTSGMPSDIKYNPLAAQYSGQNDTALQVVQKGLGPTNLGCGDLTVDGVGTLQGLNTFIDGLKGLFPGAAATGTAVDVCGTGDWQPLDCRSGLGLPAVERLAQCTAGNEYMKLYEHLAAKTTFRCDVFQDDLGNECDVKDMVAGQGRCLRSDGTMMSVKNKTCGWVEFKQYYADSETRIKKAFEYVDYAVAQKQTKIGTDLKNLVYTYFITPMFDVFDGMSCGFIPGFWQAVIDSMCFQGVYGVRRIGQGYTMSAFILMIFGICMYFFWRRAIDNVNKSQEGENPGVEASM